MANYSTAQRKKFAAKGWALPDGSYPIANKADLKNAISLVGNGKDPAAAKAHIIKRAKALGATSLLPDTWNARSAEEEVSTFYHALWEPRRISSVR